MMNLPSWRSWKKSNSSGLCNPSLQFEGIFHNANLVICSVQRLLDSIFIKLDDLTLARSRETSDNITRLIIPWVRPYKALARLQWVSTLRILLSSSTFAQEAARNVQLITGRDSESELTEWPLAFPQLGCREEWSHLSLVTVTRAKRFQPPTTTVVSDSSEMIVFFSRLTSYSTPLLVATRFQLACLFCKRYPKPLINRLYSHSLSTFHPF